MDTAEQNEIATSKVACVFGNARLWRKSGIYVLKLQGTNREMAAQHGALLREQIQAGSLPYLGERNAHLISDSPKFRRKKIICGLVQKLVHALIETPMLANVPARYREDMRLLAKAADIPYRYIRDAALQPDTLIILLSFLGARPMGQYLARYLAGGLPGCTSLVALNSATPDGEVIHARNMDYPAVGRWERYPSVMYFNPEGEDRGQRYVAITSAGVHTAGITGLNESGITLSMHFHCGKPVSPLGVPGQFIGSEIVRRATTLAEAIDIAKNCKSAGTWGFVVSSAREKAAAVIEIAAGMIAVREPEKDRLAHTNFFHTPVLREKEVLVSAGVEEDCVERYARAIDLLDGNEGKADGRLLAAVLSDSYDRGSGRVAAQGNTIAVVTTVTSLVAEAAKGCFWVSQASESPTSLGDYVGFRVDESFDGFDQAELPKLENAASFHLEAPVDIKRTPISIRGTAKHGGLRLFRQAFVAFHTDYDVSTALEAITNACAADPEEGRYHLTRGHFLMRLGKPDLALPAFDSALGCQLALHMSRVARLFKAHALDASGRRGESVSLLRGLLSDEERARGPIDSALEREVCRCLKGPYNLDRAAAITFDLQFCDPLDYA